MHSAIENCFVGIGGDNDIKINVYGLDMQACSDAVIITSIASAGIDTIVMSVCPIPSVCLSHSDSIVLKRTELISRFL